MSTAANRGDRVPYDYYPTPPWAVHRLLDRHGVQLLRGDRWLEPTVGDGAIVRAVDGWAEGVLRLGQWTGVELRRGALDPSTRLHAHIEGQDFRSFDPWERGLLTRVTDVTHGFVTQWGDKYDLAIGNPPFSLAEPIVRRALTMARTVAMLMRVDFLGSAERLPFWRGVGRDPWLRVLPDRPSFAEDGATDSSTYAWYLWGELDGERIEVLDQTPAAVRAAQRPSTPSGIPQLALW